MVLSRIKNQLNYRYLMLVMLAIALTFVTFSSCSVWHLHTLLLSQGLYRL